jgi:hypothetical protein
MAHRKRLFVKSEVDYVDLRRISPRIGYLNRMMKKYELKHLECVVFTNNTLSRFRMIINIHGYPYFSIPGIDEEGKYSHYLIISEWLARLAGLTSTRVELQSIAAKTRKRIERQKKRKKAAERKAAKKKKRKAA